jgi:hypothetical protein
MNELEIRAQAAYGYVSQKLTQAVDEIANLRAELAARDAQLAAANEKIAALTPKERRMSDFPRMLYRAATPLPDFAAVGAAIHARTLETIIVADEGEEAAQRAEGFGNVDSILAKPKKAKTEKT